MCRRIAATVSSVWRASNGLERGRSGFLRVASCQRDGNCWLIQTHLLGDIETYLNLSTKSSSDSDSIGVTSSLSLKSEVESEDDSDSDSLFNPNVELLRGRVRATAVLLCGH